MHTHTHTHTQVYHYHILHISKKLKREAIFLIRIIRKRKEQNAIAVKECGSQRYQD